MFGDVYEQKASESLVQVETDLESSST